ncbi:hypothetical protein [Flavobacterium sp. LB1P71]|uniref:hypothetical protein n=1 Tax=unclassified Flavobacterium TaxID=196869 RepID=UPI003AAE5E82
MQNIKQISALETFPIRHHVLRAEKMIDNCHFDGYNLKPTAYFYLFDQTNLIGVISIFEAKNDLLFQKNSFEFGEW